MSQIQLASSEAIIKAATNGKMFILVDDEDRENEGDLIIPARVATAEHINFMAKYGRGLICLAMDKPSIDRLGLGLMPQSNHSRFDTAFTISIEAREGVTTGISAADRARTILVASDPNSNGSHIVTPGHVFPLAARDGGVLVRAGHTEAAVDIARLAGHGNAGVICEIMNDQGEMMRLPELIKFAAFHQLEIGSIADLIAYRRRYDHLVERIFARPFHIANIGIFELRLYLNHIDQREHIALIKGDIKPDQPVPVRMHAFHIIRDVLEGGVLNAIKPALEQMEAMGEGVFVLIREGGTESLAEYLDMQSASSTQKPTQDLRDYGVGAQILWDIGVRRMRLISNQQRHIVGLEGYGLEIENWLPL